MNANKEQTILRVQWLVWSFPVFVLALINAIWLVPSLQDIEEANSKFRREVAERASDNMGVFLETKAQALRNTADRLRFEQQNQKVLLERILKEHREFNSVSILEAQGKETLRVSRFDIVLLEDLRERYNNLTFDLVFRAGIFYGQVTRTESLEPAMSVAVPVIFGTGQEHGILVGELNLKQLSSTIGRFRFGNTGKVYVVDETGMLIIDPDISLVLKSPNIRDRSIVQASEKERGVAQAHYLNENNIEVEASSVFLPSVRWQVIAEQSVAESNISRNRILALAVVSGALGIALFLLFVANNAKLRRLNQSLAERNRESNETAKILVKKDRALTRANQEFVQLTRDLDEAGKLLVRRDLELTRSNERLRDLDALKSQFVSVAAHQLRTPLAGIKWTLYAILEKHGGGLNKEQRKFASDAYKSTVRLIELVNDLLDASRLEEGRFGFKMKQQTLAPLVQKAYENFKKAATEKGITFSLQLPTSDLPRLHFDAERIRLVLENLLDNAIKYTPPGGSVKLRLSQEKNNAIVEVRDTGIGIPKDQVSKVFTKFFRAENAQLLQTSGTGLGLYLAKNIVEHHGGAIFFSTEENKGSIFSFSIPFPKT